MEDNKVFHKNIQTDTKEQFQPEHSYRDALNVIVSDEIGSISMEQGIVKLVPLKDNADWKLLGHYVIDDIIILLLVNDDANASEIGYIKDNVYVPVNVLGPLNFNSKYQADVQAVPNYQRDIVVYFTDNLNPPRWVNLSNGETGLIVSQPNPTVPTLLSVETGGRLYAGSYQIVARYVTLAGTTTDYGYLSEVIPINDEAFGTPAALFDGAFVDVLCNKKIKVTIQNIDLRMPFLEIAVIKYLGADSQSTVEVYERIQITSDTYVTTYSGTEQVLATSTIESVVDISPSYSTAKCIESHEGRLFLSNLTARKIDRLLLQELVNDITVHWSVPPSTDTWISAEHSFNEWRGEYTMGGTWVESSPLTNPIPGSSRFTFNPTLPSPIGGYRSLVNAAKFKTYKRDEVYSFGVSFIFDDNSQTPVFHIPGGDGTAGPDQVTAWLSDIDYPSGLNYPAGKIRHHKMPTIQQAPIIDGIYIKPLVIEFRNIDVPYLKGIGVTGIVFHRQERDELLNRSKIAQGVVNKTLQGDINIDSTIQDGLVVADGGGNPLYDPSAYRHWAEPGWAHDPDVFHTPYDGRDVLAFYSPDWMYKELEPQYVGYYLKPVAKITQRADYVGTTKPTPGPGYENVPNNINYRRTLMQFGTYASTVEDGNKYFIQYSYDVPPYTFTTNMSSSTAIRCRKYPTKWIASNGCNGYRIIELESDWIRLPIADMDYSPTAGYYDDNQASIAYNVTDYDQGGVTRHLYDIEFDNPEQYGQLEGKTYIPISVQFDIDAIPYDTVNSYYYVPDVYSGDTFISLFTWVNSRRIDPNALNNTLNGIYIESEINCNLRHRALDVETGATGLPYWPKYQLIYEFDPFEGIGLLQVDPVLGHHRSYNLQYSIDNNIKGNVTIPFDFNIVDKFSNRTIYSERQMEGVIQDMLTVYLANNYEDITKATGPIHDTFVHNSTLFLHTHRGLFRTFVNEREAAVTNVGQLYVGAGGVFAQPSKMIGTAGTVSQWAGINTPYGYFFVDAINKKVYLFTDQLVDISQNGLFNWHNKQFKEVDYNNDNPINFNNLVAGYDPVGKRILYTNHEDKYTLSYSFISNGWASYHSYMPENYITADDKLMSQKGRFVWGHNEGYTHYYDTKYVAYLDFVSNPVKVNNSVFDNLVLHVDTAPNLVESSTTSQLSGAIELSHSEPHEHGLNLRLLEHQWQLAIPRDAITEGRMRDKWCRIKITWYNPFTLNLAKVIFRGNAR